MKSITPFGNMFNMITRDPTDRSLLICRRKAVGMIFFLTACGAPINLSENVYE